MGSEVVLRNTYGTILKHLPGQRDVLEVNIRGCRKRPVEIGVRVGEPGTGRDLLSAAIVEILRFDHVVSLAGGIEVMGHQDAVAE